MIGWALRWVFVCCVLTLVCAGIAKLGPELLLSRAASSGTAAPVAAANGGATNSLVYTANQQGHVILDAAVNGAATRMLVDTGASLVVLTRDGCRVPPASTPPSWSSATASAPPTVLPEWPA